MTTVISMPESLKFAISKFELKYTEDEVCASRTDLGMKVLRKHHEDYGFVPTEWKDWAVSMIAKRKVWEMELIHRGEFTAEDLEEMSFAEVREEIEAREFVTTTTGTATGGSTTTRVPLKKAA